MEAEDLDVLLPVQVIHPPADRWLQRLCLAVFEEAPSCLGVQVERKSHAARRRDRHEAWAWMLSDAEYCFSFTTVCAVLHLNAEAVRNQLRQHCEGAATQASGFRGLRQPRARPFDKSSTEHRGTGQTGEEARRKERGIVATPSTVRGLEKQPEEERRRGSSSGS